VDELFLLRLPFVRWRVFPEQQCAYIRNVLELRLDQFIATCDRCGQIVRLATSDLTTASDLLRVRGWAERAGKIGGAPSYEWLCAACTARWSM
jgi:hypothetical protein